MGNTNSLWVHYRTVIPYYRERPKVLTKSPINL